MESMGSNKSELFRLGSRLERNFDNGLVKQERMDFGEYMFYVQR